MVTRILKNTCTVDVFSKKLRISGFMLKMSSGIHESPIIGNVLNAWPCEFQMQRIIHHYLLQRKKPQNGCTGMIVKILRTRNMHTASFPATNAPEIAVMPTRMPTGSASLLTFAAPCTQATDSAGGSGITTERAVQKRPQ